MCTRVARRESYESQLDNCRFCRVARSRWWWWWWWRRRWAGRQAGSLCDVWQTDLRQGVRGGHVSVRAPRRRQGFWYNLGMLVAGRLLLCDDADCDQCCLRLLAFGCRGCNWSVRTERLSLSTWIGFRLIFRSALKFWLGGLLGWTDGQFLKSSLTYETLLCMTIFRDRFAMWLTGYAVSANFKKARGLDTHIYS